MNILPTQDQENIVAVIADFLAAELPVSRYQPGKLPTPIYPDALWQQIVELGWFGISAPESCGGSGMSLAEEILLAKQAGLGVISPSILATTLAVHLALDADNPALAAAFIDGRAQAVLGLPDGLRCEAGRVTAHLQIFNRGEGEWVLCADHAGIYLLAIEALELQGERACTDNSLTLHLAEANAAAVVVSSASPQLRATMALLLNANLAGIAAAALADAVAYAGERVQFGRAIGSFQAINHTCADMAVQSESAWAQTVYAALSLREGYARAQESIACAGLITPAAALFNARNNIQIHGGVGFTEEYNAHLFAKRSHVYRQLLDSCFPALATLQQCA